jgi:Tfp pilus assembly protein PilZ
MKTKVPRRALRYPVRLVVLEVNGKRVAETYLTDISTTGFRMEAPSPYSPRRSMEFKILLPGSQKDLIFAGQVVWIRPAMEAANRFLIGVKFHVSKWEIEPLLRSWKV